MAGEASVARFSPRATFLGSLIRTAYLPDEVPPLLTTKQFSEFCVQFYKDYEGAKKSQLIRTTNYDTYSAPRTTEGRRNFAIVHPIAQLRLSILITLNRTKIRDIIQGQAHSLYRTTENTEESRAFEGLDFRSWDANLARICTDSPFLLEADISRFFYTAYTHSIPWAVLGKERVKDWLERIAFELNRGIPKKGFL